MEAKLEKMLAASKERKRKRDRIREAIGVLQSTSLQELSDIEFENSDKIICLLTAKFGWKTVFLIGRLLSKLPSLIASQVEQHVLSGPVGKLAKCVTVDEIAVIKKLLSRCNDFLEFSFDSSLAEISKSSCFPLQRILYPPTTSCFTCGWTLQLQNRPARISVFEKEGSLPGIKFTLKCRNCKINYGYSMYGNCEQGYRFYDSRQPYIESSNVVYLVRGLCVEQIYLA